jgi:hypothetical protein
LRDAIQSKDAHGRIKKRRQERERLEQEQREARDYDYYGPYYDQPHQKHSPEGGCNAGAVKAFSHDLKGVRWHLSFKPSGIKKYDESTNPAVWLEVYQLATTAVGGDSYIMANYLPVCLSSSTRMWLLGLPAWSVRSWNHLCRLFTSNFHATCAHLEVDWDLANVQKKGESLREFIQQLCNKRKIILEVEDKSIVMFFRKGLRDSSLICKLTMKNHRMSEAMFTVANKYAPVEEVTLDTIDQKKEKESGLTDRPNSSKGHDKKSQDCDGLQGFKGEVLKMAKVSDQEKILKNPRVTSPMLIRSSTTSMVAPRHMSQGGSINSQLQRSWRSHPPTLSTLNGPRSPLCSTAMTTQSLCHCRGDIIS